VCNDTIRRVLARGTKLAALNLTRTLFCEEQPMDRLIYIIGAVVVVVALLSFFGLR